MIDVGQGPPLVLIPGIQGRWEWMQPAVRALSARYRVISFSLHEARAVRFDDWVDHITSLLDRRQISQAIIVGVSFGGVVAARFAALRPERTSSLVLVSAPSPRWKPSPRVSRYLGSPLLSAPAFAARAVLRLVPEIAASRPAWPDRLSFMAQHFGRIVRFPASPLRMARDVGRWQAVDLAADCSRITAPTLVITGEPELDHVVPEASSLDYLTLIPGARHVRLSRTGHIGLITRPDTFADLVSAYAV